MATRRKGGGGSKPPARKKPPAGTAKKPPRKAATAAVATSHARVAVRQSMRRRAAELARIDETPAGPLHPLVAGVGASAGGLEAFSQLVRGLPENPGVAIVFVQHQAPQHESALANLLGSQSRVPVEVAADGVRVQPNHIYVNPPDAELRIEDGILHLLQRPEDTSRFLPIDAFFRSLATSARDRAIAVVLSGTGEDGSDGLRDVKAEGGIVLAQQPESAKFDGMPAAAVATGLVDLVQSPDDLAHSLVQIGSNQLFAAKPADDGGDRPDRRAQTFERILSLLRTGTGVDFRQYKRPTLERRVARRMVLLRITSLAEYVRRLEKDAKEVQALFQDVLILVTRFFRDPDVFELLRTRALPAILQAHKNDEPIRAWIAGCSTGEEAYSLAVLLLEFLAEQDLSIPLQIFATDVSEHAIERARNGFYPSTIAADVSAARLRRYFTKADGGYRISKAVRDVCVFARHDITRDPPFSRMDLIVCRNVLIYLNTTIQQKVMTLFHYTLKPTGFLLLGSAETVGQHSDLFRAEDKRIRLYAKKPQAAASLVLPAEYPLQLAGPRRAVTPAVRNDTRAAQSEADRLVQERYAPPGVIVDEDLQIVQFRGHTGIYLEHAPGDPSMNVLKMARDGLLYGLRTALHSVRRGRAPVRREGMRVRRNGGWQECAIEVVPLNAGDRRHFLILFHETGALMPQPAPEAAPAGKASGRHPYERELQAQIASLQRELAASRDYLQPIIQELETANEELQSANEEILSANEELQSTNEELDTAKEELQSTNEELNTVNDELRARNEELSRVNSDLENLLASVQIAIVIVARDLRIRRFTPMAERVLNLIPSDVGRPIGHIKPNIDCPDLETRINRVLDEVTPQECEVSDRTGNRYSLRIRPYKDIDNRIEGAVLALFEIQPPQTSNSA